MSDTGSEYIMEERPTSLPTVARYLPVPICVLVSAGVMLLLGDGSMTINGEHVSLAPTPEIVGALLVFVTVVWAGIEFGPGMAGGRR